MGSKLYITPWEAEYVRQQARGSNISEDEFNEWLDAGFIIVDVIPSKED